MDRIEDEISIVETFILCLFGKVPLPSVAVRDKEEEKKVD